MAADLGLGITLSLKDKLSKDANRAANSMRNMSKGAEAGVKSANRLQSALGPVGRSASRAGSEMKRLMLQVLGFAALAKVGKSIFDTNVEFERLSGALKVATGSADAGAAKFAELEKFASTTPFALEESVQAFLTLKNLGLDPSERSLKSFGNTSASMGKSLQQMIEAVADASTGEFERLKEFGIKSKQQGDKVMFTFQGVTTAVKKDAKSIQNYLIDIGETKFAGAMEEQMGRLPGVVSNFSDSLQSFFRKMGTAGFTKGMIKLINALGLGTKGSDDLAASLGELIGKGLEKLAQWVTKIKESLGAFVDKVGGLENAFRLVTTAAMVFLGVMALSKVAGLVSAFLQLVSAVRAVGIAGLFADAAIGLIPGLIVAAAVAIGVAAYYMIAHWEEVKAAFAGAVDKVVKPWWEAFAALFEFLKNGFMETASMAMRLLNPLTAPGAAIDISQGKGLEKTMASMDRMKAAGSTLVDNGLGVPGNNPFSQFAVEFGKGMAPTVGADIEALKKQIGLGDLMSQIPQIPAAPPTVNSGTAGLASMRNPGIAAPAIKVENTVNIPKTTITPAPVLIDQKRIAEVVFNVMQTQTVRN